MLQACKPDSVLRQDFHDEVVIIYLFKELPQ